MGRTTWKGFLTLGLVSAPVKVTTAAREKRISFNQLHSACGGRLNQQMICKHCDRVVDASEIVKGYEVEKGTYVRVTEDEVKACKPKSDQTLAIEQFVDARAIDPALFDASYFLAPDASKMGEAAAKPYELILQALKESGEYAIGSITLSSREHTVVIRPYQTEDGPVLMFHTMFYQNEINAAPAIQHVPISAAEMDLARQLIAAKTEAFDYASHEDTYQRNVLELIESKRSGNVVAMPKREEATGTDDLLAALKASVKAMPKKAA